MMMGKWKVTGSMFWVTVGVGGLLVFGVGVAMLIAMMPVIWSNAMNGPSSEPAATGVVDVLAKGGLALQLAGAVVVFVAIVVGTGTVGVTKLRKMRS